MNYILLALQSVAPFLVTWLFCNWSRKVGFRKGWECGRNQAYAEILVDGRVDHGKLAEKLLESSGNVQKAKKRAAQPPKLTSLNNN